MNQYQRYRAKNDKVVADLKEQIRVLIEEPKSFKASVIQAEYKMHKLTTTGIMFGSSGSTGKGLLEGVTTNDPSRKASAIKNIAQYHAGIDPYDQINPQGLSEPYPSQSGVEVKWSWIDRLMGRKK